MDHDPFLAAKGTRPDIMNRDRYQRVKQLFHAACQLDAGQVHAFLDHECGDDPELREDVESLLRHHDPTTIIGGSPNETSGRDHVGRVKIRSPFQALPFADALSAAAASGNSGDGPERFPPGTIVAGRYRMLGLLGHGGMGFVLRATDLKLNQDVALKFFRPGVTSDSAVNRFYDEVRLALKVTHPNVIRIHDLGEAEGERYISMEYVDGEDLASLLRRIGRLPSEKAVDLTRQMCAGLGAAHDQHVLHRDLKPSNIMIDGRGLVRITDFGIAALASQPGTQVPAAGTPAFMAPELLRGDRPTVQSDIYSLGVVLYEMVTGGHPFAEERSIEVTRSVPPAAPAAVRPDVSQALSDAILQCLDPEPARRPSSSYALLGKLPGGGDPLAKALEEGRTPSPAMVAASATHDRLPPFSATTIVAACIIGMVAVWLMAGHTLFLSRAALPKPPAVLAERAREVIEGLGHSRAEGATQQGYVIDHRYFDYRRRERTPHAFAAGAAPAVFFWYRQGDDRRVAPPPFGESPIVRLAPEPGMNSVHLDPGGKLFEFAALPEESQLPSGSHQQPDWSTVFDLAGLDIDRFRPTAPSRIPQMFAHRLQAWEGSYLGLPSDPVTIEAASLNGRITYFNIEWPWEQTERRSGGAIGSSRIASRSFAPRFVLFLAALGGGCCLAWYNLRRSRGDLHGAKRVAGFVFALAMLDWLLGERHSAVFAEEAMSLYLWLARAALAAGAAWIAYVAVEPLARAVWPHALITWSRLLRGNVRDPLVGRDLLIGVLFGIALMLLMQIDSLVPIGLGSSDHYLKLPASGFELGELLGLRYRVGTVTGLLLRAISLGLMLMVLLLMARILFRVPWLAALAFWSVMTAAAASVSLYDAYAPWTTSALVAAGYYLVLTRVGLVAAITGHFVECLISVTPITTDFDAWYAPSSNAALVLIAALLIYSFAMALRGSSFYPERRLAS